MKKGAMKMMFWAKVKIVMVVIVVVVIGVFTVQAATESPFDGTADTVQKPNWPFKVVTWNFNMAYPGAKYDFRLGVTGGTYPYKFKLTKGPEGLTVDENTGTIIWLAPKKTSKDNKITIEITDSKKKMITHSYSINVMKKGFYFVSPNGSDTNKGSFEQPWKSIAHARKSSKKGDVLYFRQGTYPVKKKMKIIREESHVWMSWPGETATIDREIVHPVDGAPMAEIASMEDNGNFLFQGIEFIRSGKVFRAWAIKNAIFRKNRVHNLNSVGGNNPGFVMFTDAGKRRPENGHIQHNNIVFQENVIYDVRNNKHHAAGIVCYNVTNLLFEDNRVYDIQGNGINNKDDGYFNTIRNNVIHNVKVGIYLLNQYTELNTDVSYNLVFDTEGPGITIGGQPGYIKNIFVHHNTLVDTGIMLRWVIAEEKSGNINIYNNIILAGKLPPYSCEIPQVLDAAENGKIKFQENLLWNVGKQGQIIIKIRYKGKQSYTLKEWQKKGKDKGSLFEKVTLDKDYRLPKDSPYIGRFGRQIKDCSTLMDKALLSH